MKGGIIVGHDCSDFFPLANDLYPLFERVKNESINPHNKDKKGGYCTILFKGILILAFPIAEDYSSIPKKKVRKYLRLSQEKAFRLFKNPCHASSWQSKNEKREQWGGAIRVEEYIISFSGFSEEIDEYLSFLIADYLGLIKLEGLKKTEFFKNILSISGNKYIYEIAKKTA